MTRARERRCRTLAPLRPPRRAGLLNRAVVAATLGGLVLIAGRPTSGQLLPAGGTAAVLSFVDADAGRVEVVRHWPWASSDVDVYPFVPYFWNGCPGPGAIMMLVTGPGGVGPPLADRIVLALTRRPRGPKAPGQDQEIARIAAALRTPGDPAGEALKIAAPWIGDLATYERLGYAVFLFVRWQGIHCAVIFKVVPEGYGIPFVD